ncbi:hypothetical protein SISNIDRAFT_490936 [Sistotremastrum niveocremeum HHB9708]|uniref:Uncharacterized protein n=1 Tax=Sistotremastrum niveocremeum HHB9708 TaxID=1314777 RepID=A0A164NCT1_9AGAM|nr:hypothetical protein SISNIDRAFT_490936 [Sistotremastrum niveocremeum HHB9708]
MAPKGSKAFKDSWIADGSTTLMATSADAKKEVNEGLKGKKKKKTAENKSSDKKAKSKAKQDSKAQKKRKRQVVTSDSGTDSDQEMKTKTKTKTDPPSSMTRIKGILVIPKGPPEEHGSALTCHQSDIKDYEEHGLYITSDRKGQPLAFSRNWVEKRMLDWVAECLDPKVIAEIAFQMKERAKKKGSSNAKASLETAPFIPAFRKYNSIELATAIGSWDGKGVHAGLPKGHTGNGIVTVVTAVPLPPDRYRVWTRPVVVVENAAPRMSTIAQLQGLDEAAGTEADEGSSEHGRDLEAEPESPATEPLFLKDEEDHGSNSSHRSPSPEQQPTRRRRLTKRNRTTSPVPSVAAATPTRAGRSVTPGPTETDEPATPKKAAYKPPNFLLAGQVLTDPFA